MRIRMRKRHKTRHRTASRKPVHTAKSIPCTVPIILHRWSIMACLSAMRSALFGSITRCELSSSTTALPRKEASDDQVLHVSHA